MAVEIKKITTHRELKQFIRFGNDLYKDCEHFCPQLISDELNAFDPKVNPAHEVCECVLFMAYRDRKPVGRIAGVINHAANEKWNVKKVRFGWIDFIDDQEVGMCIYRVNTVTFDTEGESETYFSLVIKDMGHSFSGLLTYLTLFIRDFVPVGIYKNLE